MAPIVLLAACGAPEQPPAEPDHTEPVHPAQAPAPAETPEFVGVITARKSEIIPAAFGARLLTLDVHQGQPVRAGDKIARLDDQELKSQIEGYKAEEAAARAQAGVGGAQAALARAKLSAERKLYALGASPRMGITSAQAELGAAGASAGAAAAQGGVAKAKRQIAERQLEKAQLTSPINGIVMMVRAREGEALQQGAPIARVADPRDLIVRFAVPKEYAKQLAAGQRVQVRVDGVDQPVWATVERMSTEEPPINFTVVEADIDDSKLRPDELRLAAVSRVTLPKKTKAKS